MANELETIEKYVQDLEALRQYAEVKAERDSLAGEVARLRDRATQLVTEVKAEAAARRRATSELGKRESELKAVSRHLRETQEELASLKAFRAKAPGDSGVPLEQLQRRFLRAEEDEVERRVQERLREAEKETRSRMPTLVRKELARVLAGSNWPPEIEKLVMQHATRVADQRLRNGDSWPDWFRERFTRRVQEAVANALDLEFANRVTAEAQKRFESLKSGHWERYSAGKARELVADVKAMVSKLQGVWWFNCDRCGAQRTIEIGPPEIAQLLQNRSVDLTCSSCVNQAPFPFVLNSVPHKVATLTLAGLLQLYLETTPPDELPS